MGIKLEYLKAEKQIEAVLWGIVIWDQGCFKDETVWGKKGSC